MLPLPVAAWKLAVTLATTDALRCGLVPEVMVRPRRLSQSHEHYTKELRCSAQGGEREVGPAT